MHLFLFTNSAQRELVLICTQSIRDCNKLSLHYSLAYIKHMSGPQPGFDQGGGCNKTPKFFLGFLVIFKQCLVCFYSGIWLFLLQLTFLTSLFELLKEYCLTNRVKLSFTTLTLQYENDMIIFLIHLKKSFSRVKGVL